MIEALRRRHPGYSCSERSTASAEQLVEVAVAELAKRVVVARLGDEVVEPCWSSSIVAGSWNSAAPRVMFPAQLLFTGSPSPFF